MKRLNNIIKVLPVFLLLLLSPACNDSFLEITPAGRISSDNFPKNDAEAFSAIIGVYNLMQWNYGRDWNSAYFAKNLPADDCNAGSSASDQLPYQNLDDFKNETDNPVTTAIWEGFYKTINLCNTIIERVEPKNEFTKQIVAEAKVLRAFNYFELVVMFGDVPFFFVNPATAAEFHKPRTPKATIYSELETDLIAAIADLPLKSQLSAAEKFRVSKGTAQSILGKIYLYQGKWALAHGVLSQVISSQEYGLEPNFGDVWLKKGALGTESVLEVLYTSGEGYTWGNFSWGGGSESNIHVQLMGPRDNLFGNVSAVGLINGWGFNLPTAKIGAAFTAMGDNGPRYKGTVMKDTEFIAAGGQILGNEDNWHDYEGYLRIKYATRADETNTSPGVTPELNYGINWRLIRYADVLLMAAEAYNEDNKPGQGVLEINKVRNRAELAALPLDINQTALREAIMKERQLELAFEGSRYWDLIRWGKAEQELSTLGFKAPKHNLFPIPANEIRANNAISTADQNPGH